MNNFKGSQGFAVATLDKFLGLYTEADPTSLPDGASPLTINDDFQIGEVYQRPGKQSVYQFGTAIKGFEVNVHGKVFIPSGSGASPIAFGAGNVFLTGSTSTTLSETDATLNALGSPSVVILPI